jgi:phytoene synthase
VSIVETSITTDRLAHSRHWCEQLTRQAAKNFYYGLRLLPEPKRSAMFALYSWMRLVDDIADDEDDRSLARRRAELDGWQAKTRAVLGGEGSCDDEHLLWPAFSQMVRRCNLPTFIFDEVIEGQRQDLERVSFVTFEELRAYCYRVAGVIGLASIYIWGFEGDADTEALAIDRGVAFQLTNILRDLREDATRGRCYLPADEMSGSGVAEEDLLNGRITAGFEHLMRFQIERARGLYERSAPLEDRIDRDSRPTLRAMTEIYRGLLEKISLDPQRVLSERVSLSVLKKLHIGWRAVRAK